MSDATARYVITADDRTKAALKSIESGFKQTERNVKSILKGLNTALGVFVGAQVGQAFRNVIRATEEAAGPTSEFSKALNGVRDASRDLMAAQGGLPAATAAFQELAAVLRDPAVRDMFDKMTSFMITAAARGASATAQFAGGVRVVLRDMGLVQGTTAQDAIDETDADIAKYERILRNLGSGASGDRLRSQTQAKLDAARDRQRQLLGLGGYSWMDAGRTPEFAAPSLPSELAGRGLQSLRRERTPADERADAARKAAQEAANAARKFQESLNAGTREAVDQVIEDFNARGDAQQEKVRETMQAWRQAAREATDGMSVYADQAARNMQDAFAQFLFDPFKGGVRGMLSSFTDALRQMVAQAAAAKIFESFGGAGGVRGIVSGALKFFGGFRAEGGPVMGGRGYIVGERGPELFVPGSSGSIVPNNRLGGGPVNIAPVYNISGLGLSFEQVQLLMQRNNRELVRQITDPRMR